MKWLLDTNACIRYLNGKSTKLRQRIDGIDPAEILTCSVVRAELAFGAAKSNNPSLAAQKQQVFLSRFTSFPFDDDAALTYGRIRAQLEAAGMPIGPNDLMIAAIAVARGVTLVSHNTSEFARVQGLVLEDWEV